MKEKTRVLIFDVRDGPTHPRPLHITNGEVLLTCESIGYDADRIARSDDGVYLIATTEEPPILNNVAIVDSLRDDFFVHTRCSHGILSVPDFTVKLRHRVSVYD
jgi:hypothetical protein